MTDSPLAPKGREGVERTAAFAEAADLPEGGDGVEQQLGGAPSQARRLGRPRRALQGHAVRQHGAGRGGATRARDHRSRRRPSPGPRARRRNRGEGAALPRREACRLEAAACPHPAAGRFLRRPRATLRQRARAAAVVRRGRLPVAHRSRARHVPQGGGLGWRQGEARGARRASRAWRRGSAPPSRATGDALAARHPALVVFLPAARRRPTI